MKPLTEVMEDMSYHMEENVVILKLLGRQNWDIMLETAMREKSLHHTRQIDACMALLEAHMATVNALPDQML